MPPQPLSPAGEPSSPTNTGSEEYEFEPLFLNSRREAIVIFGVWLLCLIWSVPVCYLLGYSQSVTPENVSLVMGIPAWTFWGIVLPWLVADIITTWFCFCYMKDDDLGQADYEIDHSVEAQTTTSAGETA